VADIVLKNVYKRFRTLTAVKDLNLEIRDKEFLVLLGPSGCGKTTTLRMISGLELPSEGEIFLDGEDVTMKRASQRDIAFMFQLFALYPHLSAYQNIAFPLKTQGEEKSFINSEVKRIAKLLQIEHILKRKPKQLAGGDMQRVALGRCLIRQPKALLLDEPIGTLDAKFREEMRTELKKLHVDSQSTSVYVTHDQMEAMSMGDRIAVMDKAVLQQVGEPFEVYSNPRNLFVAQFIGSPGMNFLDMKALPSGGAIELEYEGDGSRIRISKALQEKVRSHHEEGRELVLGIRPEDVALGSPNTKNGISGQVYVLENMGNHKIVDVKLGGDLTIRVRVAPKVKTNIGDNVVVTFDMEMVRLFDAESGDSIMY
jgi:multiple sugar transport system ATP-binding protein